jgi:hypothetical protein
MRQYITQSHPGFATGNKIFGCQITFQKGRCDFASSGSKNVLTLTEKAYNLFQCISILFLCSESHNIDSLPAYSVTPSIFDVPGRPLMVAQWLRYCATNRKVAGSIPDGITGIFHWHNPSDRTMALGSTQPLTEMSTRIISWGVKADGA